MMWANIEGRGARVMTSACFACTRVKWMQYVVLAVFVASYRGRPSRTYL